MSDLVAASPEWDIEKARAFFDAFLAGLEIRKLDPKLLKLIAECSAHCLDNDSRLAVAAAASDSANHCNFFITRRLIPLLKLFRAEHLAHRIQNKGHLFLRLAKLLERGAHYIKTAKRFFHRGHSI